MATVNKSEPSETGEDVPVLRLEQIRASYGNSEVLRGISLQVERREIIALIGPNGAGKSSLLKVIAGFLPVSTGEVFLGGKRITNLAPHLIVRQGVSYFMQGGQIFSNLTVAENLSMGVTMLPTTDHEERFSDMRRLFPALKPVWQQRAGLLSGGEKQSVALAMVLVLRPRLLLLDEPLAGLQPSSARRFLKRVQEVSQIWDTTVILAEQNVREVVSIAHRAVGLTNGYVEFESHKPQNLLRGNQEELEHLFLVD